MLITGIIILVIAWVAAMVTVDSHPFLMLGVVLTVLSFIFIGIGVDNGSYKEGQIDAINGVIQWELQEQENGATIWKKLEEKK